jgi:hypothetical protein
VAQQATQDLASNGLQPASGNPAGMANGAAPASSPDGTSPDTGALAQGLPPSSAQAGNTPAPEPAPMPKPNTPPATLAADSGTPDVSNDTNAPAPDRVARNTQALLDISLTGTNVVFVLDRSPSMSSTDKTLAAQQELVKTLRDLSTNQNFYIVASPNQTMPAPTFLAATDNNIDSVTNWIFATSNSLDSASLKTALQKAYKLKPDTLCLLSDGQFFTNAIEAIVSSNDLMHASMNTVNFFDRQGETVLRPLAEDNNGTYHFVPPPATNQVPTPTASPAPTGNEPH